MNICVWGAFQADMCYRCCAICVSLCINRNVLSGIFSIFIKILTNEYLITETLNVAHVWSLKVLTTSKPVFVNCMHIVTVDDTRKIWRARIIIHTRWLSPSSANNSLVNAYFVYRAIEKPATPNLTLLLQCNSFQFNLLHAFCFTIYARCVRKQKSRAEKKREQTRYYKWAWAVFLLFILHISCLYGISWGKIIM